jgi:hypothetical protein
MGVFRRVGQSPLGLVLADAPNPATCPNHHCAYYDSGISLLWALVAVAAGAAIAVAVVLAVVWAVRSRRNRNRNRQPGDV